jgi:transaldolase
MKIFIDTANIEEIKEAASWGILDGVTTNPSLVAKEGRDFKEVVLEICKLIDGPINAEVVSMEAEGMLKEADDIVKWHKNIVIKLPCTWEGIKACKKLSDQGVKTNVTLVFSATQALLAAKAGATYVSPFIGRLTDISHDAANTLIKDIVKIFDTFNYKTEIISASIRTPMDVLDVALAGSHIATIPFKIIKQLMNHPLTDKGIQQFLKDWESVTKKG